MIELTTAVIPVVISAILVGFYGAVKYYAKTLGANPELFDIKKFLPIVILSVLVSVAYAFSGATLSTEAVASFVTENFVLVIFIDQAITIYTRAKVQTAPPA